MLLPHPTTLCHRRRRCDSTLTPPSHIPHSAFSSLAAQLSLHGPVQRHFCTIEQAGASIQLVIHSQEVGLLSLDHDEKRPRTSALPYIVCIVAPPPPPPPRVAFKVRARHEQPRLFPTDPTGAYSGLTLPAAPNIHRLYCTLCILGRIKSVYTQ
jgi:hypothetical protein